jgi:hypothetical protein
MRTLTAGRTLATASVIAGTTVLGLSVGALTRVDTTLRAAAATGATPATTTPAGPAAVTVTLREHRGPGGDVDVDGHRGHHARDRREV